MTDLRPNITRIEQDVTAAGNDMADNQDNPDYVARQQAKVTAATSEPHPWLARTTTFGLDELKRKPRPREIVCDYFPIHATSAVVGQGGVSKTTLLACLSARHVTDDLHAMFVSAEDGEADYQAKLHNALYTESGPLPEASTVAEKIHVLNLKGQGVKLIQESGGSFIPSTEAVKLAHYLETYYPKVRVVYFETVSRFAGGEDNERMEAVVSACDRIAMEINGACVLVHHTGKGQARDKVIDLYSGRGGSALGDNTRSMVVLTRLDSDYRGSEPIVIDHDDLARGRAFEVTHVRNSYGPTRPPAYYITRHGYCYGPTLEPVPIASAEELTKAKLESIERQYNAAATRVCEVIKAKGGKVPKKFFDSKTKSLIGVTQEQGRELIKELLDAGTLEEFEDTGSRGRPKMLRLNNAGE